MSKTVESDSRVHLYYLNHGPRYVRQATVDGFGATQYEVAVRLSRFDGEVIDLNLDVELATALGMALVQEAYLSLDSSDRESYRD